jgi:hypothetical protein
VASGRDISLTCPRLHKVRQRYHGSVFGWSPSEGKMVCLVIYSLVLRRIDLVLRGVWAWNDGGREVSNSVAVLGISHAVI